MREKIELFGEVTGSLVEIFIPGGKIRRSRKEAKKREDRQEYFCALCDPDKYLDCALCLKLLKITV